jgi:hypothetical protein
MVRGRAHITAHQLTTVPADLQAHRQTQQEQQQQQQQVVLELSRKAVQVPGIAATAHSFCERAPQQRVRRAKPGSFNICKTPSKRRKRHPGTMWVYCLIFSAARCHTHSTHLALHYQSSGFLVIFIRHHTQCTWQASACAPWYPFAQNFLQPYTMNSSGFILSKTKLIIRLHALSTSAPGRPLRVRSPAQPSAPCACGALTPLACHLMQARHATVQQLNGQRGREA